MCEIKEEIDTYDKENPSVDIRKVDKLKEHPNLRRGQKVKLRIDFYDGADFEEDRKPVHRKGDVGSIDGFGVISGQEVVAVEICHHGSGEFKVIPVLPSDLEKVPDETPVAQPDQQNETSGDVMTGVDSEKPIILLDIKKTD